MTDTLELPPISTPTTLAKWLAPRYWGRKGKFRADPWILMSEAAIVDGLLDDENDTFIKINAPAQVGKSTFVEVFLVFWILGMFPDKRVILIAYNDILAEKSGAKVRELIKQYGKELFGIEIDPEHDTRGNFGIAGHQGGMISVGIGSSITGQPGDVVIIGDIIKNMQEAASKVTKETHWTEWNGTIMPRFQDGCLVLVCATRFADDDLSGRLEAQEKEEGYDGDRWQCLNFPAIAEPAYGEEMPDDPDEWRDQLGRKLGEPLQTRFTRPRDAEDWEQSRFYRIRRRTMPFEFSCIYQQNPTSPTGGMFPLNNWRYFEDDDLPPLVARRRSWDLATTEGSGDWTVGADVARDQEGNIYVLDIWRDRKNSEAVFQQVKTTAKIDGVARPILIERERNGAGKSSFTFYKLALPLNQVHPIDPDGKKEERWKPYSILQQGGKVYLRKGAPWLAEFTDEHRPIMGDGRKGRYDDQVDAVAMAINHMLDYTITEIIDAQLYLSTDSDAILDNLGLQYAPH